MPAVANIVLADAQATPVNHTFIPLGPDANQVWWYEDQSQASAIGFWKVSISLSRPAPVPTNPFAGQGKSVSERRSVAKVALWEPVLENVSNNTVSGIAPAPTVSYVMRSICEFSMPERSSLQNRKDLRKMFALLLGDTQVVSVIENLQSIY